MENNIKAIEKSLALTRRCLPLFNGKAVLQLQLGDKILKLEQLRNQLLHAYLAAASQPATIVSVVIPSSTVAPMLPPLHTVAAALSATVTAPTSTGISLTRTSAATIKAPHKYPEYSIV